MAVCSKEPQLVFWTCMVFFGYFFDNGQCDLVWAFQYSLLIFCLISSSFWVLLPIKKSHLKLSQRLDPALAQVSVVPLKQRRWPGFTPGKELAQFDCDAHVKHDWLAQCCGRAGSSHPCALGI